MTGCRREQCTLLSSDFEQYAGWTASPGTEPPAWLTTEQAHSGRYSQRILAGQEYGAEYRTTLSQCGFVPRRLLLSAWVYAPSGRIGSTKLVVYVDCHGRRPAIWQGFDIEQVVKRYRKWEQVQQPFALPSDVEPGDEVKVLLWHPEPQGENIWLDDLRLLGER
ncbi:MAG: hypothetical protein EOO59_17455 [Hymenobacter sp.]|nr:MAG: hypothetical protein EOO59_17455 [Hymenobacter sp.]